MAAVAFALDYSDLWWIPVFALGVQMWTTLYLIRIHRKVGRDWTRLFATAQILRYIYLGMIFYGLYWAANVPGTGVIEIFGLFFGFAFPIADNIIQFYHKRFLWLGLQPNKSQQQQQPKNGAPVQ